MKLAFLDVPIKGSYLHSGPAAKAPLCLGEQEFGSRVYAVEMLNSKLFLLGILYWF